MKVNKTLRNEANRILIKLLSQCTEPQQLLFKRMYSHKNLGLPINEVIENMPDDKVSWAIDQCENTLRK